MKKIFLLSLLSIFIITAFSQSAEESVIKQVLEKESATWRSGDIKGHADCWHLQPYSRILVSTGDGTALDIPPASVINPPAGSMGNGGSSSNSNYTFSVHGDNAWVSHNEESINKEGKKTYSYEMRILEKIDGQWKLVGQSIHISKPK